MHLPSPHVSAVLFGHVRRSGGELTISLPDPYYVSATTALVNMFESYQAAGKAKEDAVPFGERGERGLNAEVASNSIINRHCLSALYNGTLIFPPFKYNNQHLQAILHCSGISASSSSYMWLETGLWELHYSHWCPRCPIMDKSGQHIPTLKARLNAHKVL